jgi:hypothetical protein
MSRCPWFSRALPAALAVVCYPAIAPAGVLPLNVFADNDSAFYEYFSDGFVRMDQFASTRPANQNFHAISNPAVEYGQSYDGFPNDRFWRFGSITFDESGLTGGTGAAPITGLTFNFRTDPANPTYANFFRYTINTIIDTSPIVGTVQVESGLPTGASLEVDLRLEVVNPLGATTSGTYPGSFSITGDQFELLVEGTQQFALFNNPPTDFPLKWDFSGKLRSLAVDNGDYDGNGRVDGSDLLTWQRTLGQSATPAGSGADGDSDGAVDADDLGFVRDQFGFGVGSGVVAAAQAVPEPGAFALCALAAAGLAHVRRDANRRDFSPRLCRGGAQRKP